MAGDDPEILVSTGWLARHLHDPDLRVLDASWYLPAAGRDAAAEYAAGHIPGARFFDIDAISDRASPLPHMAPPPRVFAAAMQALGLGDGQRVVVYDGAGLFSAPRVWWTFRLMGKSGVAVLDGGLPKWRAEGRPLATGLVPAVAPPMTAALQPGLVRSWAEVAAAARTGSSVLLDARPAARFRGEAAEPRAGLRPGHVPGARNLPFADVLTPEGTLKTPAALAALFAAAGVDLERPIITSCGSGVTAAVLDLALERIGHRDHAIYDGSWAEWGASDDLPVERG